MKREGFVRFLLCFLFNCLALIPLNGIGQEWVKPVKNTILLSGNFGELRATHFHSGIDIRTGGAEGWPVICVKDGQLVRVSVSPTGYGQALYIEHPDGTTTVYGHLQRFVPCIAEKVRKLQYQRESFRIDEDFKGEQLFFRQGDTIAFSGNSGSSGGPHLHFEVRNTQTEHTINPLRYYAVRDTRPPVARMLYLYTVTEKGYVQLYKALPLKALGGNRYGAGKVTVPSGKIGAGIYVTDYMNDSWNKLGVYRLDLSVKGDTLYRLKMDSCSFSQNCLINEVKDFDRYKKKETVYRCFGNYQSLFLGADCRDGGYIKVVQDSVLPVEIALADINGNRTQVEFTLKGGKAQEEVENLLRYNQAHVLELPGCRVSLEAGALYASVKNAARVEKDTLTGQDVFILSEKDIPLFKKASLFISGEFSPKAVICEMDATGRKFPVQTQWTAKGLRAEIGYLNRYTVAVDEEAPEIQYLGKFPDRTLRFKVKDRLSGLASWRGEVNGEWCLFAYDPRVNVVQCSMDESVFRFGSVNEVSMQVEDYCRNQQKIVVKVKN